MNPVRPFLIHESSGSLFAGGGRADDKQRPNCGMTEPRLPPPVFRIHGADRSRSNAERRAHFNYGANHRRRKAGFTSWWSFEAMHALSCNGIYLFGAPVNPVNSRMWNQPFGCIAHRAGTAAYRAAHIRCRAIGAQVSMAPRAATPPRSASAVSVVLRRRA